MYLFIKVDNFKIEKEGGIYYINGDVIISGKLHTYRITTFYVNGNLIASEIVFCGTSLGLDVKGKVETSIIYSSIEAEEINITSIDKDIKGIIINSSYSTIRDQSFLLEIYYFYHFILWTFIIYFFNLVI